MPVTIRNMCIWFCTAVLHKGVQLLPGVRNGLPADWRDELDGELLLLGMDVTFICRMTQEKLLNISLCNRGSINGLLNILKLPITLNYLLPKAEYRRWLTAEKSFLIFDPSLHENIHALEIKSHMGSGTLETESVATKNQEETAHQFLVSEVASVTNF